MGTRFLSASAAISYLFLLGAFHASRADAAVGYPLLLLEPDARGAARGESGLAAQGGLTGMFQSPVASLGMESDALGLVYLDHLQDVKVLCTAWGTPRPAPWVVSLGLLHQDDGSMEGLDAQGQATGSFDAGETLFLAGLGRRLPDWQGGRLDAGIQAGLLHGVIEEAASTALLLNGGVRWEREQFSAGLSVRNFGRVLSAYGSAKDELPRSLEAGAAWRLAHLPFTMCIAWQKIQDRDPFFKLGGELRIAQRWHLGLGYHVERGDDRLAGVSGESGRGFTAGIGGDLPNGFGLDWAWSSFGELGSLNRLALTWSYGK